MPTIHSTTRTMTHHAIRQALLALGLVAVSFPAHADIAAQAEQAAAPAPVEPGMSGEHANLTVGMGISFAPRFAGADRWQFLPAPIVSAERGPFFVDTLRGIGLQYESGSRFFISQSLFYDPGRLERDSRWRPGSSSLGGMGDVPSSSTSRTILGQQLTPWMLASIETEIAIRSSMRRNRYRAGVEFTPFKTANDTLTIDVDVWWGDGRYNQAYFGVTPQQAARTGRPVFIPRAGLYAQMPSVSWEHRLDIHWSATLQMTASRYGGTVAGTSIVAQRMSASATSAIAYAF